MHGSPYHVYPAKNYPQAQPAFQGPPSGVPSVSASPQLNTKIQQLVRHVCLLFCNNVFSF